MTPSAEVDARNLLCPLPVLRLRKVLLGLAPGGTVRLIATDPAAQIDVPHFCETGGHRLLSQAALPDGAREYLVMRGPDGEQSEQPSLTAPAAPQGDI
ncbi:MAG: sulfurtransferase TusA family protein [Paracoccus sp. (in: a-proteobacteria)]|uniref:sulfurtransferase TusA family protein n=1 Tax=Paracoccus sp. TaxID=267 RepID=UPI0026DF4821|nr:sulfurtransferase TusA family protein [Paracoccus sp. (in: a-proteobacteria)]MDO5619987.1 sulfurtransferase TusA family protein [Paracoccus sp. (in: a-proteobacteria)]